jgi:hypothetical protein
MLNVLKQCMMHIFSVDHIQCEVSMCHVRHCIAITLQLYRKYCPVSERPVSGICETLAVFLELCCCCANIVACYKVTKWNGFT